MTTPNDPSGARHAASERCALGVRIAETPAQGAVDRWFAVERPLLLGREPGPTGLTVHDPRVSGVHLTLYPGDDGQLLFRDMGSKNGTFHNGRRASGGVLAPGDVLRLGSTLVVAASPGAEVDLQEVTVGLVGRAPAFKRACEDAHRLAPGVAPVLITGEVGTGKEAVARLVHARSGRTGPFVVVDCATLPEHLATSAVFGQVRAEHGAAPPLRRGLYREAAGGTLFLDAVGELPLDLQPRLLRALEHHEVASVGAMAAEAVDVRVVAAADADLASLVASGRFRADLYARLAAHTVAVPPLRERREDILPIARSFAGASAARLGVGDALFEADLAEVLLLYPWPQNLRELRQVVEWLALPGRRPLPFDRLARRIIDAAVPPAGGTSDPLVTSTRTAPLKVAEAHRRQARPTRAELEDALAAHAFNISAVARVFARDRKQIYRWVSHYGIELPADADGS